ncbi:uncharacterized protein LOC135221031 [Macrobrachium nipponense]|uniref:uncharacterized protein LOC135221031 n=1 Tax=Macrobrachium nipponense TaxID=159736 RepID=UPI0030C7FA3B
MKMLPSKLKTSGDRMEAHNDHIKPDLNILWTSVILLLIVAGIMVFLLTSRSILSDPSQQSHQSEVISLKGRNISYTYLEAIDNYFTDTKSPVIVYTPQSYEAAFEEHLWYFGTTEKTGGEVTAAVFTPSNVKYLQLLLRSKQTTITVTYSLNCSSQSHKVKDTECSPMRRMAPHDKNTIVADVSNDVQPWLSGEWKLTIKTVKWNKFYEEEDKMQPALCIQHRGSRTAEESPLQNILKSFLVNRINEQIAKIPIKYQGEEERQRKRKQRSTPLECQMFKLEMSLNDLGLAKVILPTQVYLTYCRGTCLMLDDPELFTVNALVRAKYTFLFGNDKVPSPECVPTHFRPLPFFVQLGDQIRRVTFEDLDATRCGCR